MKWIDFIYFMVGYILITISLEKLLGHWRAILFGLAVLMIAIATKD